MYFSKFFLIQVKPIIISQLNNPKNTLILKTTYYKFIINFNFFKKTFLILFILINLYSFNTFKKQVIKVSSSKIIQNTKFYIWFLKFNNIQQIINHTYYSLPNVLIYKPFLIDLYKVCLTNNLLKGTLIINNFIYLVLKKKWYNLSFKHGSLNTIQNWIEYYIYCNTYYNFEFCLRFFIKQPCLTLRA